MITNSPTPALLLAEKSNALQFLARLGYSFNFQALGFANAVRSL
jgi:hypothetical protein